MPVAIITGGSSGLGLALTGALAEQGWQVVVDARDAGHLERALTGLGAAVHAVPGDVTDARHRDELVRRADALGGPDLLVNNAGGLGPSPLPHLTEVPPSALTDLFEVNVLAPLGLIQLTAAALTAREGTIVNVTSDAATTAYPGWGVYGATKAALEQLGAVLGVECSGALRVYSLDPGDLRTPMHQAAFPGTDISDRPLPQTAAPALTELIARRPPSGRYRAADLLAGRSGKVDA